MIGTQSAAARASLQAQADEAASAILVQVGKDPFETPGWGHGLEGAEDLWVGGNVFELDMLTRKERSLVPAIRRAFCSVDGALQAFTEISRHTYLDGGTLRKNMGRGAAVVLMNLLRLHEWVEVMADEFAAHDLGRMSRFGIVQQSLVARAIGDKVENDCASDDSSETTRTEAEDCEVGFGPFPRPAVFAADLDLDSSSDESSASSDEAEDVDGDDSDESESLELMRAAFIALDSNHGSRDVAIGRLIEFLVKGESGGLARDLELLMTDGELQLNSAGFAFSWCECCDRFSYHCSHCSPESSEPLSTELKDTLRLAEEAVFCSFLAAGVTINVETQTWSSQMPMAMLAQLDSELKRMPSSHLKEMRRSLTSAGAIPLLVAVLRVAGTQQGHITHLIMTVLFNIVGSSTGVADDVRCAAAVDAAAAFRESSGPALLTACVAAHEDQLITCNGCKRISFHCKFCSYFPFGVMCETIPDRSDAGSTFSDSDTEG